MQRGASWARCVVDDTNGWRDPFDHEAAGAGLGIVPVAIRLIACFNVARRFSERRRLKPDDRERRIPAEKESESNTPPRSPFPRSCVAARGALLNGQQR